MADLMGDATGKPLSVQKGEQPLKKKRDPFLERKDAWLEKARSHPGLMDAAFRILHFVSDHAGIRKMGYTYFRHSSIAKGVAKSVSATRRALANAEECDLLRIRRRNLHETNEYWPCLEGEPLIGEFPVEIATSRRPSRDEGCSKSTNPACSVMNTPLVPTIAPPGRSQLSTQGIQDQTTIFLMDPPNRPAATTTESLLPLGDDKNLRERKENLEIAASMLGVELTPRRIARWSEDLKWYVANGLDFRLHVVPAITHAIDSAASNGYQLQINTLRWFAKPAEGMRECLRLAGLGGDKPERQGVPSYSQDDKDRDDVKFILGFIGVETTPDRVHSFCTNVKKLRHEGVEVTSDLWPTIERCVALGIVPRDIRSFRWFVEKAPKRIAHARRAQDANLLAGPRRQG